MHIRARKPFFDHTLPHPVQKSAAEPTNQAHRIFKYSRLMMHPRLSVSGIVSVLAPVTCAQQEVNLVWSRQAPGRKTDPWVAAPPHPGSRQRMGQPRRLHKTRQSHVTKCEKQHLSVFIIHCFPHGQTSGERQPILTVSIYTARRRAALRFRFTC